MKTEKELQAENLNRVLRDGPNLGQAWKNNVWICGKDRERGRVLLGGLGSFGVGVMWVQEEPRHKDYPHYDDY